MKQLVVVRHGQYAYGGHLDDRGCGQMVALAEKLASFIYDASVLILTSPTSRTRESAEILGAGLNIFKIQEHKVLWSDRFHAENLNGALQLVKEHQKKADVLVLVTHHEYAQHLPEYFAQKELGAELHSHPIGKGEAWVLDVVQKTLTHVC